MVDERIAKSSSEVRDADPGTAETASAETPTEIFKVYKGHRVEGTLDPATSAIRIMSSPWDGKDYLSPTAAAIAVVEHYSPDRAEPNTNGRRFWKLSSSGESIDTIIGRR